MANAYDVTIRPYREGDHVAVAETFTRAIHEIGIEAYTRAQCLAWSDIRPNPDYWRERCERMRPWIAEACGPPPEVAAFLELEPDGHIHCAYTHPDFARRGVMTTLASHAVAHCRAAGLPRVYVEASLHMRPLMHKLGFAVTEERMAEIRGERLRNFRMELVLQGSGRSN
ncbi:hypothetical protein DB346_20570 [Verrucomicrobia bacterium LW23]|nr:hypothetical protein DB346_20570 [Verrucomicrobia bacterium LW23]